MSRTVAPESFLVANGNVRPQPQSIHELRILHDPPPLASFALLLMLADPRYEATTKKVPHSELEFDMDGSITMGDYKRRRGQKLL